MMRLNVTPVGVSNYKCEAVQVFLKYIKYKYTLNLKCHRHVINLVVKQQTRISASYTRGCQFISNQIILLLITSLCPDFEALTLTTTFCIFE